MYGTCNVDWEIHTWDMQSCSMHLSVVLSILLFSCHSFMRQSACACFELQKMVVRVLDLKELAWQRFSTSDSTVMPETARCCFAEGVELAAIRNCSRRSTACIAFSSSGDEGVTETGSTNRADVAEYSAVAVGTAEFGRRGGPEHCETFADCRETNGVRGSEVAAKSSRIGACI